MEDLDTRIANLSRETAKAIKKDRERIKKLEDAAVTTQALGLSVVNGCINITFEEETA